MSQRHIQEAWKIKSGCTIFIALKLAVRKLVRRTAVELLSTSRETGSAQHSLSASNAR
jgi:hypothetical protein